MCKVSFTCCTSTSTVSGVNNPTTLPHRTRNSTGHPMNVNVCFNTRVFGIMLYLLYSAWLPLIVCSLPRLLAFPTLTHTVHRSLSLASSSPSSLSLSPARHMISTRTPPPLPLMPFHSPHLRSPVFSSDASLSAPIRVHTGNRCTSTVGSCPRNARRSSLLSARTLRANLPIVTPVERTGIPLVPGRIGKNQHLCTRVRVVYCMSQYDTVIPLPSPSETSYLGHHKASGLTSAALKHNIDCISHPIHKHRLFRSLPPYQTLGPITNRHYYSSLVQQRSEDP